MISRRQIISGQHTGDADQQVRPEPAGAASSSSSAASKASGGRLANTRQAQKQWPNAGASQATKLNKTSASTGANSRVTDKKDYNQQQRSSRQTKAKPNNNNNNNNNTSDDYLMSSSSNHHYEDYTDERSWRQQQQQQHQGGAPHNQGFNNSNGMSHQQQQQQEGANMNEPFRQHFDPYSIYSDDEEAWCSEERLFEVSTFLMLLLLCRGFEFRH